MKFYRNLIILAIVLIGLIVTYIFVPKKNETENGVGFSASNTIVKTFKVDDIKEIALKNFSGSVVLERIAQDWKMTAPAEYKLDTISVSSFVKNICNFKALDIIDDKPTDISVYGLKSPTAVLTVKTKNGISTHFKIGSALPVGSGYYLMTSDSNIVYSISDFMAGDILRTSAEFRDKTIFAFSKKDVSYITVSKQGKDLFKLKRNKAGWDVITLETKAGDSKKIESVIDKLSMLKVKEFINPNSYNKEEILGEKDRYTIVIGIEKQPELKLLVGKDLDEGSTYAEKVGSQEVFTVYKGDVNFVSQSPKELVKN